MYKIPTNNKKRIFEVDFYVVSLMMQVGNYKHTLIDKSTDNEPKKALSGFWGLLGKVLEAPINTG